MDSEPFQVAFGIVVRRLRAEKGYSQESFADVVRLHRTYVGSIERGERNISLQNLRRLADALRMPLSQLVAQAEHLLDDYGEEAVLRGVPMEDVEYLGKGPDFTP